ncbi:MAG: glycogen synthase [Myxococcales bacterium]|nr:MAG: glycogen synthase [Myxococcales bacterium]
MKVLFCTTELAPFSRVGGLAEFSSTLTAALGRRGAEATIITPLYRGIDRTLSTLEPFAPHPATDILLGDDRFDVRYWSAKAPVSGLPVIFVECDPLFGREGIYTNPSDGKGFADNPRRFALFQEAILHLVQDGLLTPDVIHLNDYHTALIPAMLKARAARHPAFVRPKTALTIHNAVFQADTDEEMAWRMGLGELLFAPGSPYRRDGRLNFLKTGVLFADKVAAVSPSYAAETRSDDALGYGLAYELDGRGKDYAGILNGVDYGGWDPRDDQLIVQTYTPDTLQRRTSNKEELLALNGLDAKGLTLPTIGMITRLTDNKGFDLLTTAIDKLMTFDLTLVMLGTGEAKYHKLLESVKMRYPHKLGLNLTYSNRMAHIILAGSDFFLMPSRFEPCGQHQMYAMRYGAAPIVHATGGLADTVVNASDDGEEGWGFTFRGYDVATLLKTIWRAVSFYKNKKQFRKIVRRAMQQDFSWEHTADAYFKLYKDLLG